MPTRRQTPDPFREYRKVQAKFDSETRVVLEQAARDIQRRINRLKPGVGGRVRAAQLRLVLREIERILKRVWDVELVDILKRGRKAAMMTAEDAVEALEAVLHGALADDVASAVSDGLRLAAVAGITRDAARVPRELSSRVYKNRALTTGAVTATIRRGLVEGLSAKELAKDVYDYVSPSTPGGASYAAMRLARTEINNSFHEQQIEGAKRPGVTGVKWNLSGSHRVPDECNIYADTDQHGMGAGVFPPGRVPDRPHPQCFCYLTYVTMSADEFADAMRSGSFDDEIERRTKANLKRLGMVPDTTRRVPSNDKIEQSYKSGIAERETLYGGAIASTQRLTFKDGTEGVSKVVFDLPDDVLADMDPEDRDLIPTAKDQQDAEELGAMLARAMGLKAPQVYRPRERETIQQFMEGRVAGDIVEAEIEDPNGVLDQYRDTDQGWLIGLLDQVIGNNDRNDGNWLVDDEGNLIPIDHGSSWQPTILQRYAGKPIPGYQTLFGTLFMDSTNSVDAKWKDNDLHPDDLVELRSIMMTLRPEFERRGQEEWFSWSMGQIDAIMPYAKGPKRRIS